MGSAPKKELPPKKPVCSHGPNAKCLNCAGVTDEEIREHVYEPKCDHPAGGMCPKCMNKEVIKDVFETKIIQNRQNMNLLIISYMK